MPPMPPSIFVHFPRDDGANNSTNPENSKPKNPPKDAPNAAVIAVVTLLLLLSVFLIFVVFLPWLKRRNEAKQKKQDAPAPSISQLLDKNSRFDRSFHGHRRAPSQLNLVDPNPAYMPDNRRPPVPEQSTQFKAGGAGQRDRDNIPAVHFRDQPEEIRQVQDDRPVSYQYYIPPPNDYVESHFPPTPTTGRNTGRLTGRKDDGDPFADQPPSSQLHPYHDVGLDSASPSPKVPDNHWDQYHHGQQSSRTPHTNGLIPKSVSANETSASPLTAYINHLNALGEPPATAPVFSSFNAPAPPRSAGVPYQHQQQQAIPPAFGSAQPQGRVSFDHGLSSGSSYSESPASRASRPSSAARPGIPGYGPGTRGLGYDNNVPHSMPTKGHVSFAHEQTLARGGSTRHGAGTALRDRFSPRPSPGMGPLRSAGFPSAAALSPGHLSANPMQSHFSPMTPDYRQSRMPLPLDALPEVPNSSIAYGFALPPSPLSPGDEIVVSPSPYHANFAINR